MTANMIGHSSVPLKSKLARVEAMLIFLSTERGARVLLPRVQRNLPCSQS